MLSSRRSFKVSFPLPVVPTARCDGAALLLALRMLVLIIASVASMFRSRSCLFFCKQITYHPRTPASQIHHLRGGMPSLRFVFVIYPCFCSCSLNIHQVLVSCTSNSPGRSRNWFIFDLKTNVPRNIGRPYFSRFAPIISIPTPDLLQPLPALPQTFGNNFLKLKRNGHISFLRNKRRHRARITMDRPTLVSDTPAFIRKIRLMCCQQSTASEQKTQISAVLNRSPAHGFVHSEVLHVIEIFSSASLVGFRIFRLLGGCLYLLNFN